MTPRGELQILRLDVAVNNLRILRMQVVERVQKLIRPGQYLIGRKGALLDCQHMGKIFAGDELHHQKLTLTFSEVIANTRQRGMVHARKQPCFSLKLLPQTLISKERLLQCHSGIKTFVNRLVNRAHSPLTELPYDPIAVL